MWFGRSPMVTSLDCSFGNKPVGPAWLEPSTDLRLNVRLFGDRRNRADRSLRRFTSLSTLRFPLGNETSAGIENRCGLAKRRQRRFGLGDQRAQARPRALRPEQTHDGRLAGLRVLTGLLADQCRIAFDIEQIVGDLEGLTDGRAVAIERVALRRARLREDSTSAARKFE